MHIDAPYALGTFEGPTTPAFAGLLIEGRVARLSDVAANLGLTAVTIRDVLEAWDTWDPAIRASIDELRGLATLAYQDLTPLAPVEPRQILCTGANYKTHVAQMIAAQPAPGDETPTYEERFTRAYAMMEERGRTGRPYAFVKLPTALTGATGDIICHTDVEQLDWELELAVVIGKGGFRISRDRAMDHIAGYTIANDISARDFIYRADLKVIGTDWLASKCRKTYLPLGPVIVPAYAVPDPLALRLTFKVDGQVMQDETTSDMIFSIQRQIEYVSSLVELYPGDIICTGSPAGNGMHHNRFLTPGTVVEATITGLGVQRNLCVAERGC